MSGMDNGNENGSILAPESRTGGKDGSEVVRPSKGSENAPEALKTEITIFATSSEIMIDLMGDVSTAIPFAMMGKCDRRGTLRLLERIEAFLRDGVKDGSALIGPLTHAAMQAKLDRVGIELAEAADLLQAAILREAAQAEVIARLQERLTDQENEIAGLMDAAERKPTYSHQQRHRATFELMGKDFSHDSDDHREQCEVVDAIAEQLGMKRG